MINGNPIIISHGGGGTLIEKTISKNGVYNPQDDNADAYSKVTVDVSPEINAKYKIVNKNDNSGIILKDDGYDAIDYVVLVDEPTTYALPSEYQRVEYLIVGKQSRTSVTLTNVKFVEADEFLEISCCFNTTPYGNCCVWAQGSGTYGSEIILNGNSRKVSLWSRTNGVLSPLNNPSIVSKQSGQGAIISDRQWEFGERINLLIKANRAGDNANMTLGDYNFAEYFNAGYLYSFAVYDKNRQPKCKLVPCYRISDSVCGWYDYVGERFLTPNIGTYTAGPDVT